jgi:hypothetical protein
VQNDFFSPQEKEQLLKDLANWSSQADHWHHFNNEWDLFFKIALLAISLFSVIAAGTIATKYKDDAAPWWLALFNASAAALVTALAAFAFTTVNFAARALTYETKRNEFGAIINELKYLNPTKTVVLQKLEVIHSWSSSNPAPAGGLPKTGQLLSAATGAPTSIPSGSAASATASPSSTP